MKYRQILLWGYGVFVVFRSGLIKIFRRFYQQQHQLTSVTAVNRYPELFSESVSAAPKHPSLKILSFGCSTGEECFSLAGYFPQGQIVGVDINKQNLRKANRENHFGNVKFLFSSEENILANGPYDVIYCLSVLCRWDDTQYVENCEQIYSFQKYNETVTDLVRNVKTDGLLVIYNSNFMFEDTPCSKEFEIVDTPSVTDSGFVYKFDVNNMRSHLPHRTCIYRKK